MIDCVKTCFQFLLQKLWFRLRPVTPVYHQKKR